MVFPHFPAGSENRLWERIVTGGAPQSGTRRRRTINRPVPSFHESNRSGHRQPSRPQWMPKYRLAIRLGALGLCFFCQLFWRDKSKILHARMPCGKDNSTTDTALPSRDLTPEEISQALRQLENIMVACLQANLARLRKMSAQRRRVHPPTAQIPASGPR